MSHKSRRPRLGVVMPVFNVEDRLTEGHLAGDRAPGTLLSSTSRAVAALREPDVLVPRHAAVYEAFRSAYRDPDDGNAAARAAERLRR